MGNLDGFPGHGDVGGRRCRQTIDKNVHGGRMLFQLRLDRCTVEDVATWRIDPHIQRLDPIPERLQVFGKSFGADAGTAPPTLPDLLINEDFGLFCRRFHEKTASFHEICSIFFLGRSTNAVTARSNSSAAIISICSSVVKTLSRGHAFARSAMAPR